MSNRPNHIGGLRGQLVADDQRDWIVEEMVCIVDQFPVNIDEYGSQLRMKLREGMKEVINNWDYMENKEGIVYESKSTHKGTLTTSSLTKSGFYFIAGGGGGWKSGSPEPKWIELLYYDARSHSTCYYLERRKMFLDEQKNLRGNRDTPTDKLDEWQKFVWSPSDSVTSILYYIGSSCPKRAGIINWRW